MSTPERSVEPITITDDSILFPACLYGDTDSTREAWKNLAAEAWRAGTWDAVRPHIKLIPVHECPGPIIVWNRDRIIDTVVGDGDATWSTHESVWQLNWILEAFPVPYEELVREYERHFALVLDGMRDLWFFAGLLEAEPSLLPFLYEGFKIDNASQEVRDRVIQPFMRKFVHWLPDLMKLDDRIAIASGRTGVKYVGIGSRLYLFADLLYFDGKIDQSGLLELFTKRRGEEVVARLLEAFG